jgi:hypothetical protein
MSRYLEKTPRTIDQAIIDLQNANSPTASRLIRWDMQRGFRNRKLAVDEAQEEFEFRGRRGW